MVYDRYNYSKDKINKDTYKATERYRLGRLQADVQGIKVIDKFAKDNAKVLLARCIPILGTN